MQTVAIGLVLGGPVVLYCWLFFFASEEMMLPGERPSPETIFPEDSEKDR